MRNGAAEVLSMLLKKLTILWAFLTARFFPEARDGDT